MSDVQQNAPEWTQKQREYMLFVALPDDVRGDFDLPATETGMAAHLGLARSTLFRWRQKEGWQDAVNELARRHLKDELPKAFAALRRSARQGGTHLKTYLEILGEYRETTNQNITMKGDPNAPIQIVEVELPTGHDEHLEP